MPPTLLTFNVVVPALTDLYTPESLRLIASLLEFSTINNSVSIAFSG